MLLEVDRYIDAPLQDVWRALIDTQCWPLWGPTVRAVTSPDRFVRLGTRGRVQTAVGLWVPFQVTQLEPHRMWRWRVAGVGATGHRVERVADETTRLVFEVPVWATPYAPVCAAACRRMARLLEGDDA